MAYVDAAYVKLVGSMPAADVDAHVAANDASSIDAVTIAAA